MNNIDKKNIFSIKKLAVAGIFTALITILTMLAFPIAGGYIHLGDGMIYACAWAVGGVPGAIASALGSALADILLGYPQYAIATLFIKFAMAYVCYAIMKKLAYKGLSNVFAMAVASIIMVVGYCICDYFLGGIGGAIAGIYGNLLQAIAGMILGTILVNMLNSIEAISPYISWKAKKSNEQD